MSSNVAPFEQRQPPTQKASEECGRDETRTKSPQAPNKVAKNAPKSKAHQ
jgi:hypothetical protein